MHLMRLRLFLLTLIGRSTINSGNHVAPVSTAVAKTAVEDGDISLQATSDGEIKLERFLRGGSYSSGGSSYHSSGSNSWSSSSSNYNNHYNNQNYHHSSNRYNNNGTSSMGRFLRGVAIAGLLGLGIVCFLPLLCCCGVAGAAGAAAASASGSSGNHYVNQSHNNNHDYCQGSNNNQFLNNNNHGYRQGGNIQFQNRVQQAKAEVENMSSTMYQQQNESLQPFSGQYTTSFADPESGKVHNAAISIFFTPDPCGKGYRINGQGSDIDGNTVIEDGFANYNGSAWWVEKNISGDLSLQVLSRGKFDFRLHTFEGTWFANSMLGGTYLSFSAANMGFNSYQSQCDVPMVVATPDVPTVVATPEPSAPCIK